MEAINYASNWINWLLFIIPAAATTVIIYFSMQKSWSTDEESIAHYEKRISITVKGAIIAFTISGVITIIKSYYS